MTVCGKILTTYNLSRIGVSLVDCAVCVEAVVKLWIIFSCIVMWPVSYNLLYFHRLGSISSPQERYGFTFWIEELVW